MSVLFHLTMPDGPMAALEAVMQDVQTLQKQISGSQINHFYPGHQPGSRVPRQLWGLAQLPRLRHIENRYSCTISLTPTCFPSRRCAG